MEYPTEEEFMEVATTVRGQTFTVSDLYFAYQRVCGTYPLEPINARVWVTSFREALSIAEGVRYFRGDPDVEVLGFDPETMGTEIRVKAP